MHRTTRRRLARGLLLAAGLLLLPPCALGLLFAASTLPPLEVPPQATFALRGVTLINPGPGGERRSGVTLEVEGGRITAITDVTDVSAAGAGGYVLPGLIDAHVHSPILPGEQPLWATLYLLHGVTAVRNLGDGNQSLRRKAAVASGREAGPRLSSCGVHLDGEGGGPLVRAVRTKAEARAVVRELSAAGADCIKVLPHLPLSTFTALREEARAAGLPILGHMVNAYGARGIEESGIADVQHLTGVPESPSPGLSDDEWRRFRRGFDALSPARLAEVVSASLRLGVRHTPTLVGAAYEAADPDLVPRLDLLPAWYGPMWRALERARPEEDRAQARRNLPRYLDVVRALHQAGVAVQAGSDVLPFIPGVVPGAGLHDELRLLARAGFSAEEALAAATTVPGEGPGGLTGLGRLRVGGPADLVVFGQDPTTSLAHLSTLLTVVVDGRRYEREALQRHLRVQLAAAGRFPYAWSGRILGWLISVFA